mmetsp:Transcript_18496/g.44551  ORF Transcript_18496/g.44551 Transcript_18496/m.44551 type:complete len:88 (-) Transcript_18496:2627-2890(-)
MSTSGKVRTAAEWIGILPFPPFPSLAYSQHPAAPRDVLSVLEASRHRRRFGRQAQILCEWGEKEKKQVVTMMMAAGPSKDVPLPMRI